MNQRNYLVILYDYYGELLNEDNKKYFEDYYFDNLSLSEIADNAKISRNAVHKHIKSTENKLLFFEDKLKLCQKEKEINNILESIEDENLKNKIKKIFN